jgi:N-acetyl-anhydromuramyl-L-alanine amidase AmpD
MRPLTDYLKLSKVAFWKKVDAEGAAAETRFLAMWNRLDEDIPSQEDAAQALDDLFLYSHKRIREHSKVVANNYPTTQVTKNRLGSQKALWWVDHFTAGISEWSTLNWFSAGKVKKKNGSMGLAGASTHFVMGYGGEPFYIIPLMHGAWHEPRKNKDGLSIEHVNSGGLSLKDDGWHYWARKMPTELVQELPPTPLGEPFKGLKVMQPFTLAQIIANIKLKRLVIAALPSVLTLERMSEHDDWREGKTDMGPLWPREDCNQSAFAVEPLPELSFLQKEGYTGGNIKAFEIFDGRIDDSDVDLSANPSYGFDAPTHDDDEDEKDSPICKNPTVEDLQKKLYAKGYMLTVDGIYGKETTEQVKRFQADTNRKINDIKARLKVDGIAGPRTMACLFKE